MSVFLQVFSAVGRVQRKGQDQQEGSKREVDWKRLQVTQAKMT